MRGRPLKTSTVWKLVRERIEAGGSPTVFDGLWNLALTSRRITHERRSELTGHLRNLLGGYMTYDTWVRQHHWETYCATPALARKEASKQGQLAWLDHLIAEAKAKGD